MLSDTEFDYTYVHIVVAFRQKSRTFFAFWITTCHIWKQTIIIGATKAQCNISYTILALVEIKWILCTLSNVLEIPCEIRNYLWNILRFFVSSDKHTLTASNSEANAHFQDLCLSLFLVRIYIYGYMYICIF